MRTSELLCPNPFNPTTRIGFSLYREEHVTLAIYDVKGRLVTTLLDERALAGVNSVEWDGRDANGNVVSGGVYFYRLEVGAEILTKRMVLLK